MDDEARADDDVLGFIRNSRGPRFAFFVFSLLLIAIISSTTTAPLQASRSSKLIVYIPLAVFLFGLILVKVLTLPKLFIPFGPFGIAAAAIPPAVGGAFVIWGAGEYFALAHGEVARGVCVSESRAILSKTPPPTKWYFSNGFVAKEMAITHTFCSSGSNGGRSCDTYTAAPVYIDKDNVNATPMSAWAVARGASVKAERCPEESAGLCGLCVSGDLYDGYYNELTSKIFKENYPGVEVSSGLGYFHFEDPEAALGSSLGKFIAGLIFMLLAISEAWVEYEDERFRKYLETKGYDFTEPGALTDAENLVAPIGNANDRIAAVEVGPPSSEFALGTLVRIEGVPAENAMSELNGECGEVISFIEQDQRYCVKLDQTFNDLPIYKNIEGTYLQKELMKE